MDIRIRRLTLDDAAILQRVAVDVFDEPVNAKRLAAYLAEPGHLMIVALAGDEVGSMRRGHSQTPGQGDRTLYRRGRRYADLPAAGHRPTVG